MNFHAKKLFVLCLAIILSCGFFVPPVMVASETKKSSAKPVIKAITPETLHTSWAVKWWIPRHKEKLARIRKGNVDLLMIGDSIMHGWEGRGKAVWQKYYTKRNAVDLGFSGDRTENVLWRLQNGEVKGISPKLAVLMIGTNNAGHRKEKPEYTAMGVKAIITELHKRLPKTKVLLLAIFPRGKDDNDPLRKLNMATNKIIAKYADNKTVFFLDINKKFLDKKRILHKEIMPDLLHPNGKGYEIWAKATEPLIKKLMGEKRGSGKKK